MKTYLLYYAMAIVVVIGCSNKNNTTYPYNGTYELHSQISIAGLLQYPRGNGQTISFMGDQVKWKAPNTPLKRQFTLYREIVPYLEPPRLMDKLTMQDFEVFIERSNDTLSLYPVFFTSDAGGSTYVKLW